jgi:hypothetical protein
VPSAPGSPLDADGTQVVLADDELGLVAEQHGQQRDQHAQVDGAGVLVGRLDAFQVAEHVARDAELGESFDELVGAARTADRHVRARGVAQQRQQRTVRACCRVEVDAEQALQAGDQRNAIHARGVLAQRLGVGQRERLAIIGAHIGAV